MNGCTLLLHCSGNSRSNVLGTVSMLLLFSKDIIDKIIVETYSLYQRGYVY